MKNNRVVKVNKDGEWRNDIEFLDMEIGDWFILYEPTGEKVTDRHDNSVFEVKELPYTDENGVESVEVEPVRWYCA